MSQTDTRSDGSRAGTPPTPRRLHLQRLARAIETLAGIPATIVQGSPTGPAHLHVGDDHIPSASEDVSCDLMSGDWWYVWSGGRSMAPVRDPYGTALAIARTLTVRA